MATQARAIVWVSGQRCKCMNNGTSTRVKVQVQEQLLEHKDNGACVGMKLQVQALGMMMESWRDKNSQLRAFVTLLLWLITKEDVFLTILTIRQSLKIVSFFSNSAWTFERRVISICYTCSCHIYYRF